MTLLGRSLQGNTSSSEYHMLSVYILLCQNIRNVDCNINGVKKCVSICKQHFNPCSKLISLLLIVNKIYITQQQFTSKCFNILPDQSFIECISRRCYMFCIVNQKSVFVVGSSNQTTHTNFSDKLAYVHSIFNQLFQFQSVSSAKHFELIVHKLYCEIQISQTALHITLIYCSLVTFVY